MTVNSKIFALPVHKLVPSKIKAQFEIEDDFKKSGMTTTRN